MGKKGLKILAKAEEQHCSQPGMHLAGRERRQVKEFAGRAAVVTLGCAKNQVDSEVILGTLRKKGFDIVTELPRADVVVVNTCGFLQSAVDESVRCINELSELKHSGSLRKLIVAGCAVERYGDELKRRVPQADAFVNLEGILGVAQIAANEDQTRIDSLISEASRPYFLYDESTPREIEPGSASAYIKVSEGCDRPCTFCIIPKIRGPQRSRQIDSVVREAQALAAQGVSEINLVAQDLTAYGKEHGANLTQLLRALDAQSAARWIRLLYLYPLGVDRELLRAVADLPSICEYIDIPLQHSSEAVLKEMRRPLGKYSPRSMVEFIRKEVPGVAIRTTFITGFPGESEQDVADLEQFISEGHFLNVGVFTYSPEIGTPAAVMANQIPEQERAARRDLLMRAQAKALQPRLQQYVGRKLEVMLEGTHPESQALLVGRARFQAPEVDGTVIINNISRRAGRRQPLQDLRVGEICRVDITDTAGYDLIGTLERE